MILFQPSCCYFWTGPIKALLVRLSIHLTVSLAHNSQKVDIEKVCYVSDSGMYPMQLHSTKSGILAVRG